MGVSEDLELPALRARRGDRAFPGGAGWLAIEVGGDSLIFSDLIQEPSEGFSRRALPLVTSH